MRRNLRLGAAAAFLAFGLGPGAALAQREIVQPLPPEGSAKLNDALTRLARNSQDVSALVDAGEAALSLGDIDAAIGFFGRARELSPSDSRITLGLATAYTRSRRPVEALRLFADAERAGVAKERMAEDRALAFDLVGDSRSAQGLYQLALSRGAGAETRRRLALSYAISGNRKAFEDTLLPLLKEKDLAAFRTRAFGLAILGDTKEAVKISDAMLPGAMAQKMRGYLEYMPRLTEAQQAAAGLLGIFPRAASIGRDDSRIAAYSGAQVQAAPPPPPPPPPPARTAEAQSTPAAADPRERDTRRRPDRTASRSGTQWRDQFGRQTGTPEQATRSTAPVPSIGVETPPRDNPPVVIARQEPKVELLTKAERAELPQTQAAVSPPPPPPPPPPASPTIQIQLPAEEPEPTIEDAFAAFTLEPSSATRQSPGAVDITRIEIPREKAEPPPPPKPVHPSRHWVQVATGKDLKALGFDWRRISRKAEGKLDGKGPFTTPWVEANRLLAGPFKSAADARAMMNELKDLGIDTFTFTSGEGEAITPLD